MVNDQDKQNPKTEQNKNQSSVSVTFWLISVFVSLAIGAIGMNMMSSGEDEEVDQQELKAADTSHLPKEFSVVNDLYYLLDKKMDKKIDVNKIVEGALKGMAEATGDPYTMYFDPKEAESFDNELSGSFEGIGAEVVKEGDIIRIVAPIAGSPAEKAGLVTNDIVYEVDGQSVADLSLREAVDLIRGEKGTTVELTIERNGQKQTIEIVRGEVPLNSVAFEVIDGPEKIAHIRMTSFSDTTYDELLDALKECENQDIKKMIFDVRGNPGGLLTSALQISNLFVPDGKPLMQAKTTEQKDPKIYKASQKYGKLKFENQAVLLVDEGSASASEILAGALKSVGIPLVGTKTFGKGTIQSVQKLSNGGDIKYTIGQWLTADGEQINEKGIVPNYEIAPHVASTYHLIDSKVTYQLNDHSEEVKNIKNILSTLGYAVSDSNVFDEQTRQAVIEFQSAHSLEKNGMVTGETAQKLVQALRDYLKKNDPQVKKAVELLQSKDK